MGHMAEAEDEVVNAYPEVSDAIRKARLEYQNSGAEPDLLGLIELTLNTDQAEADKKLAELGYK